MISGKVWKFGNEINTDLIVPGFVLYSSEEEQKRAVFSANRPGWVDEVAPGDIIIGGRNFGMGSSRPGPRSLRNLGLACLLAESINGLFLRNAVNFGFLALEVPGVATAFEEGDIAEVELANWTVKNKRAEVSLSITPFPLDLLQVMQTGGIFPGLEAQGLIGGVWADREKRQTANKDQSGDPPG
jgi:3-isopropylmalate/(R)-2-methylmalate dehydratase small subunit